MRLLDQISATSVNTDAEILLKLHPLVESSIMNGEKFFSALAHRHDGFSHLATDTAILGVSALGVCVSSFIQPSAVTFLLSPPHLHNFPSFPRRGGHDHPLAAALCAYDVDSSCRIVGFLAGHIGVLVGLD